MSLEEAPELVAKFGGICYPAHIDRPANGIISVLGTFPETPHFDIVEINQKDKVDEYVEKFNLQDKKVVISSDAHYLENMRDKENFFEVDDEPYSSALVRQKIFEQLK